MLNQIFNRDFFKDRTMLVLFALLVIFTIINLLIVFLKIEARNYQVAVRYSDFSTSLLQRGEWSSLYSLAAFSFVAGLTNISLAVKIHHSRRDIAIAVLLGGLLIAFINMFVSWSLLGLIETSK
jgi:uncharacterized membrane protein YkvI